MGRTTAMFSFEYMTMTKGKYVVDSVTSSEFAQQMLLVLDQPSNNELCGGRK